MRTLDRSRQLQQRAERLLPGGVDSPVRAFRAVGGDPPFLVRAEGAYLWDADGNRYVDYFGSWGPMILGHAFPPVVEAIQQAAARSASFGASTASEADLAELITRAVPSMEKLRFVSSGTEATMSAIRLARAFTNRKYIIKFEGCYHGHADGLLVKAGSGVATFGIPGSAGVPEEIAHFTLALPYNDFAAVEAAFAARPNEIAAIILEPVAGNMGCIAPEPGYLEALRELTQRAGRAADLRRSDDRLSRGPWRRAAALSHHAGPDLPGQDHRRRPALRSLRRPGRDHGPARAARPGLSGRHAQRQSAGDGGGRRHTEYLAQNGEAVYGNLDQASRLVAQGVASRLSEAGVPVTTNRVGAMWTWFFTNDRVVDFTTAATSDTTRFGAFHRAMLDAGVWLPPSQFEAIFLGTAHTADVIDATISAARQAVALLQEAQPAR